MKIPYFYHPTQFLSQSMTNLRIESIDVLRGMTIFLMIIVNTPGSWSHVYAPLLHATWHGCTLTDLVFPCFLYVVGLSMSISFNKMKKWNPKKWLLKTGKRAGLIFLVGVLLNWFPFYHIPIDELRIFGVLQRIALSFLGASILIIFLRKYTWLILSSILLLLLHWFLLLTFGGENPYSLEDNVARTIDLFIIGENHMYGGFGVPFDPEGILGTITGITQVLIGYLIGKYFYDRKGSYSRKMIVLLFVSLGMFVISKFWDIYLPINKPIWTSSYVLYTCSIVSVLFLFLSELIDRRKMNSWTGFFKVFGKNPLISYVVSGLIIRLFYTIFSWSDTNVYAWLYSEVFTSFLPYKAASLMMALCYTFLIWIFAYVLHRKNLIIKL